MSARARTTNPVILAILFLMIVVAGAALTGLFVMIGAWALHQVFPSIPAFDYRDSFLLGLAISILASLFGRSR